MSADMLAGAILRSAEQPGLPATAVGVVSRAAVSGAGFVVWVSGVLPRDLMVSPGSLSSVFIGEARAAGPDALVGRRVVVHFAAGQPLIAYTLGV